MRRVATDSIGRVRVLDVAVAHRVVEDDRDCALSFFERASQTNTASRPPWPVRVSPAASREQTHRLELGQEVLHRIALADDGRIAAREHALVQLVVDLREDALERGEASAERAGCKVKLDLRDLESARVALCSMSAATRA